MNGAWDRLAAKFNALKPRERLMVFLAGIVLIAGLVFVLAIDGAMVKRKLLHASLDRQQSELQQMQEQNSELIKSLAHDPDQADRLRIDQLRQELAKYDAELRGVQQGLVAPERMVRLLEGMLAGDGRIRLVRLKTLPVSALVEHAEPQGAADPAVDKKLVYKHGIELTVEGSYLDLVEYQAKLEKLPWRMLFARTSIDSTDYPRVQMTLILFTLSLEEAWLVV